MFGLPGSVVAVFALCVGVAFYIVAYTSGAADVAQEIDQRFECVAR